MTGCVGGGRKTAAYILRILSAIRLFKHPWQTLLDCQSDVCSMVVELVLLGQFAVFKSWILKMTDGTKRKPREIRELREKLNGNDIDQKQEAIRGIISYMTNGKDVSSLFMDVLKNITTPSLQLKKLIYLYVMSYAKAHPDLAILGVNTFRKDAVDKSNPFLRALAVRTMGCIRIKDITEYLLDPLKKALKDQDPYVRKTGVLCIPKMYEISPELIEKEGFLTLLEKLINDGNATVVSNTLVALSIVSQLKGHPLLNLNETLVQKLLTAMNDCNEWGVVYIMDTLTGYIPKDPHEAENIMERVSSRLAHTNSAVALSSIRLIIRYMDYLSSAETIRNYNTKISAPLITMIGRENEISYLVLKTINLVLQKRPLLLPKQLKIFFVNYHDPLYVKLEKLEVLSKIANNENILMILHELKEYIHEVDVEFVRKTVNTMGKCAIKLEKMADKCVQCLWETLKTKISYVVQEAVIVIRDIFRKYPNKYDGLLTDICENLNNLDDPEAKASIVWIIGEYIELIDNADELMANFVDNFKDEPDVVQQQVLTSCMKLYLLRPQDGQEIMADLLRYITKECQNPDLRDRGFVYWRLISTNPEMAKRIVLAPRPLISEQSYTLETEFLEKLIENIGYLSSVYLKKPEDFVKRLKDIANAKQEVEEDVEELLAKNAKQEKTVFFQEQQVSFANKEESLAANTPTNHFSIDNDIAPPVPVAPVRGADNLLDLESQQPVKKEPQGSSLLDLDNDPSPPKIFQTSMEQQQVELPQSLYSTSVVQTKGEGSAINFLDAPLSKNIVVPYVTVISETDYSREKKYCGLSLNAAFQREGEKVYLQMLLANQSHVPLSEFALKINKNAFNLNYSNISIEGLTLNPGQERELKLELSLDGPYAQLEDFPYHIDCALKAVDDAWIFRVPCSLTVGIVPKATIGINEYKEIVSNESFLKRQEVLDHRLTVDQFVRKLEDNGMIQIFRQGENSGHEKMAYGCQVVNGCMMVAEIIFDTTSNAVNMRLTGPTDPYISYFHHALSIIANL